MRARTLLLISLVLNVALISALVTWMSSTPKPTPAGARPIITNAAYSNQPLRIVKTNILVRPRAFTWQEVESPDYAVYVENLRALGMPETTIRDIIVADVDQIFTQRQREDAARQDMEWWRSTPSLEMQSNLLARAEEIESERQALLAKLLGSDWAKGRPKNDEMPVGLAGLVLGALSDEVKASVQEIAQRSRARMTALVTQSQALGQPLNPVEIARLRDETRQQLAAVLPAAALEEFLLRYSENANQLRRELAGFNATPEEFRALFRAVDAIDSSLVVRAAGTDADAQRARAVLEAQRLSAIRTALGPQRFAAYQTFTDPAYRDAISMAEQVGGDGDTALALYEISRKAGDEVSRIRNDASLSEAQRLQQLREAEAEQLRARAQVLGGSAEEVASTAPAATAVPSRAHEIIPGDTLGILAVRYGVSINAIREANPGVDINRARPGTVITVPPPGTYPPASIYPPGVPVRR
jgi:LysM repeat protein